jgi:hypothetical protein
MPRRRRRHSKHSSGRKERLTPQDVVQPEFAAELMELRRQRSEAVRGVTYRELLVQLESVLAAVNGMQFLSQLSFGTQVRELRDPGEWGEVDHVGQFHNELAQAVVLRRSELGGTPLTPEVYIGAIETLLKLSYVTPPRRQAAADIAYDERERALDSIRTDWAWVRNWAVPSAIEKLIAETWAPLEDDVRAATGVRIGDASRFLFTISSEIERRLITHLHRTAPLTEVRAGQTALKRLGEAFPGIRSEPDFADRAAELQVATGAELRSRVLLLASRALPDVVSLSLDQLIGLYPGSASADSIEALLERWSLRPGDTSHLPFERLFDSNPIWTRPFIQLESSYALAGVTLIQSFAVQLIEALVEPHPELMERYARQRARYLERRAEAVFAEAFPSAAVTRNAAYRPAGALSEYENDLLVVLDDTALVIELKSNRIGSAARRGAEGSAEDAVERLIVTPAEQATRFEHYLRANLPKPKVRLSGQPAVLDLSAVTTFLPLTVTYEDLGLWARPLPLKRAGLVPHELNPARPLLLTDAVQIFDLLSSQATRIDFLERRAWLDKEVEWVGDDNDLVALYLHNHLRVSPPPSNVVWLVTHASAELQPYFVANEKNWPLRKPQIEMTPLWRDILAKLEAIALPGWLAPCRALLSVAPRTQRDFARQVDQLRQQVKRHTRSGEMIVLQPDVSDPTLICGFAYDASHRDEHVAAISDAIADSLASTPEAIRALALGFTPHRRLPQEMFTVQRRRQARPHFQS